MTTSSTRTFVFLLWMALYVGYALQAVSAQPTVLLYTEQHAMTEPYTDDNHYLSEELSYLSLRKEVWKSDANVRDTNDELTDEEKHSMGEIAKKLRHYPNPVRRTLTIEDPDRSVNKIVAYSGDGKRLFERNRDGFQQFFIIDMEHLPNGSYYFSLVAEGDLLLKRFRVIKQHNE